MAKKGTPEYEEWLKKYKEKRALISGTSSSKPAKVTKKEPSHTEWLGQRRQEVIESQNRELLNSITASSDFNKIAYIDSFRDKCLDNLCTKEDFLVMASICNVDYNTLSVEACRTLMKTFDLDEDCWKINILSHLKNNDLKVLKAQLLGIYNFINVASAPSTYPASYAERYSESNFTSRYNNSLRSLILYLKK